MQVRVLCRCDRIFFHRKEDAVACHSSTKPAEVREGFIVMMRTGWQQEASEPG